MRKKRRAPRAGALDDRRRKHRRRVMPKWLRSSQLDAIARSRCLMLLSVLSGETPVSDAIAQAKISRAAYYQLETRALNAMLTALNPLASSSRGRSPDLSAARIAQLEERVKELEQQKRRSERLLLLSRKALWRRLTPLPRGRPAKNALPGLILSGRPRSKISKAKAMPSEASIPTRVGETAL
jgi:hypothetical protein